MKPFNQYGAAMLPASARLRPSIASPASLPRFAPLVLSMATLVVGSYAPSVWAEAPVELEEVLVTSDPLSRDRDDLSQPIDVLSEEALRRQQTSSIGQMLANQPGVNNSDFGQAVGRPVIRGLGGARVKVMQNGLDSMDMGQISPDHAVAVDTHQAQQVEILRGPAALLYGNDAVGGAVNVVDTRIPLEEEVGYRIGSQLQSVSEGSQISARAVTEMAGFRWQASAAKSSAGDYQIPHEDHGAEGEHEDTLHNSEVEQGFVNVGVANTQGNLRWGWSLGYMNHQFGLPGHEHHDEAAVVEETTEEESAKVDLEQTRLDGVWIWQPQNSGNGWQEVNGKLAIVDYVHTEGHEDEDAEVVVVEEHDHGGLSEFKRRAFDSRVQGVYRWSDAQSAALGVQVSQSQFEAHGGEAIVPHTDAVQLGVYALHSWQLSDAWQWDVSARLEQNQYEVETNELDNTHLAECGLSVDDFNGRDFQQTSLSTGWVWRGSGFTVKANGSRVERSPSIQALYTCGAHESTLSFEQGDPTLNPELASSFDVALQWVGSYLTADVSVYQTNIADFIYQQPLGVEIDGLDAYAYEQSDARLEGYEWQVQMSFMDHWQFAVFGDDVVGKFEQGESKGQYIPRMPAQRNGFAVAFESAYWSSQLRWTQYEKQSRLAENETETAGFAAVDWSIDYLWVTPSGQVNIYGGINNLLDETMRYHTSFVKDEVVQPARNVKLGVVYQF